MRIYFVPGPRITFDRFSMDVLPGNTISEMVSLFTLRHTNYDALELQAYFNGQRLSQEKSLLEMGLTDGGEVELRRVPTGCKCALV